MDCTIESCLCQLTNQPVTEAVYGERPRRRTRTEYEPRGGGSAVWRLVSDDEMDALASRFPKARRFAARRKEAR